ncbi:MAG: hypothetical protein R3C17_02820 [Planctomycetaceae bacterium]
MESPSRPLSQVCCDGTRSAEFPEKIDGQIAIEFRRPTLRRNGNAFVIDVDSFPVTVTRLSRASSEYVLVAGVVKTAATSQQSRVILQVKTLNVPNGIVQMDRESVPVTDENGTIVLFVQLLHTAGGSRFQEEKYSSEWQIKDLKPIDSDAKRRTQKQLVTLLPY